MAKAIISSGKLDEEANLICYRYQMAHLPIIKIARMCPTT